MCSVVLNLETNSKDFQRQYKSEKSVLSLTEASLLALKFIARERRAPTLIPCSHVLRVPHLKRL